MIVDRVTKEFDEHPFIVFMAKYDEELIASLETVCKEREMPFVQVVEDEDAIMQRQLYNSVRTGVFILHRAYGRSYDLKLGTEALVLILANDSSISYVEAIQMVGRGCRSQGQGKGILFLKGDPKTGKDGWLYLRVRNKGHRDPGGQTLRFLFQNSKEFTQSELKKIAPAFLGDTWKCNGMILMDTHPNESSLLQKVEKRRQGKLDKEPGSRKSR